MRTDILERKEDILHWIESGQSKSYMCRQFKCKPETLNSYLKKMGIEYSGNQGGKGIKDPSRIDALEYAQKDWTSSHKIKIRLIEDGYKEEVCENCGETEWMNKPIPLELHHINGDRFDNRLENLQILCPNCHAQTSNYSGKNS